MRKRVASIEEAIKLAYEGKRSGEWDLFRGQIDARWFVTSSAERLPESERQSALQRFERFVAWAETIEPMARYFIRPDSLWAIAQHYGFATNFIDFTDDPKVAAFFACDAAQELAAGQEAAIVCLKSNDLIEFFTTISSFVSTPPEVVRIDVENLWRLQSQRGCFVWNPIKNIEQLYDFDRIVFPYVKTHQALPHRDEIYPKDQSALEKILADYFMNERMAEGNKLIKENELPFIRLETPSYDAAAWDKSVEIDPDWATTQDWHSYAVENVREVIKDLLFELPPNLSIDESCSKIKATFTSEFIEVNRRLTLGVDTFARDQKQQRLISCLRRLWNGMRNLPYLALEIAQAISVMLDVFEAANRGAGPRNVLGDESVEVEFASGKDGRGSYSRGTVTKSALLAAYNPSFTVAAQKKCSHDNFVYESLWLPARPRERFTFSGLRRLMVEQLIPTQVVFRGAVDGENALRTVIYFSPADLNVFGLP